MSVVVAIDFSIPPTAGALESCSARLRRKDGVIGRGGRTASAMDWVAGSLFEDQ